MATSEGSSSRTNCCGKLIDHMLSLNCCLPFLEVFLKMDEPASHIAKSLSLLEKQEQKYQSFIYHTLCLKRGIQFLEMFLEVSTNEDLKSRIKRELCVVRPELHLLANSPIDGSLINMNLERRYIYLRKKLKNVIIKPDTRECDVIFLEQYSGCVRFCLKRTNDFLVQICGDISNCSDDMITTLMPEIEGTKELLIFLQPLLTYVAASRVKFPWRLVDLLDKAACLLFICLVDKMNEEVAFSVKHKLSELREMINVKQIYIETFSGDSEPNLGRIHDLMHLLDSSERSKRYLNNPSKKLYDKLESLYTSIRGLPCELSSYYLPPTIPAVITKSIPILYSCHLNLRDMKEEIAAEVNSALSEVLDQIEHIQEDGCRCITLSTYPKIGGLGFLDQFLRSLEDTLKAFPMLRKNKWHTLFGEFDFLRSFLRTIEQQHDEHGELRDLWTRIVGLAYQAEYVFALSWLPGDIVTRHTTLLVSKIIKHAKLIKVEADRWIIDEEKCHSHRPQVQVVAKTLSCTSLQAIDRETDEVVGFEEHETEIMNFLLGDERHLDFISITGMPGIGKTTLANKMYEHHSIVQHFDVRAWCTVSQTYHTTELLKTILGDVVTVALTDDKKKSNDEFGLAECLYKTLKGRRYLIVFDDIWDNKAWNEVQRCFPDDRTGSRILITTRDQHVASNMKEGSMVHTLHELADDKSLELFLKNLKPKQSFSEDFLEVGNRIVQSCRGLPLAIVVIARLLVKVKKSVDEWNKVASSLRQHILENPQSPCMSILELSYSHLPDNLKSCFLYFGAFPEDEVIAVRNLKQLWIAEGFVCNSETKDLDDVAQDYLEDLISRSLVIATEERSLEGTKACRVHDLLYEFCLKKAKEESFLRWERNYDDFGLSEVWKDRLIISHRAWCSSLSVRSLLHISTEYSSFKCENFKLLTVLVLHVRKMSIKDFAKIGTLRQLRYLALDTEGFDSNYKYSLFPRIPSTISYLWNLQYFILSARGKSFDGSTFHRINALDSLWNIGKLGKMRNLRHVHIYPCAYFSLDQIEKTSGVDNLEKLSIVRFQSGEEVACLSRLPKLKKLSCIFDESTDGFAELDFLEQLVSLKVRLDLEYGWPRRCEFIFPPNLQKLTLSARKVSWEEISRMGTTLRNLKVLKIDGDEEFSQFKSGYYYSRGTWCVNDEDFPQLKYLKLSALGLEEWTASDDCFPRLEQLVLEYCSNLKEIPSCFGGSYTLQMITVKGCGASVKESAMRIRMEQEEMSNDQLKIYLH